MGTLPDFSGVVKIQIVTERLRILIQDSQNSQFRKFSSSIVTALTHHILVLTTMLTFPRSRFLGSTVGGWRAVNPRLSAIAECVLTDELQWLSVTGPSDELDKGADQITPKKREHGASSCRCCLGARDKGPASKVFPEPAAGDPWGDRGGEGLMGEIWTWQSPDTPAPSLE